MNIDETTPINLYAFWLREGRYESARVSRMEADGRVTQTGFGGRNGTRTVSPCRLVPVDAGERLAKELRRIDDELDAEISRLRVDARDAREIVLGLRK